MKELIRERDFSKIGYFRSILESAGIPTYMRNENESLAIDMAGSPSEFWPALCVVNDDEFERAVQILKERIGKDEELAMTEWTCKNCEESNPGNFDLCWSCQSPYLVEQ